MITHTYTLVRGEEVLEFDFPEGRDARVEHRCGSRVAGVRYLEGRREAFAWFAKARKAGWVLRKCWGAP